MPRIDDILAGVIKGAQEAGAGIEMLTVGKEEKLAGAGGAAGSLAGPLGSAAGAGLQDKNWGSAAGAGAGALLGGAAGTALGGMAGRSIGEMIDADPHLSQTVGSILGMLGGGAMGGHLGQNAMRPEGKMASIPGVLGGGLLGGLGGGLGGAAAGMGTSALAGHVLGLSPAQTQELAHVLGMAGGVAGGTGGMLAGAQAGRTPSQPEPAPGLLDKIRGKFSSAEDAYLAGSAEATARFKVAFLPLVGALAGPMLGRMALGRIAGGALGRLGGGAVGRMAGGLAKSKGLGGAAVDMGASMAGQQLMS